MTKYLLTTIMALLFFTVSAQDKSQRPSPPAQVSKTVGGKTVTIDYSQPALKGRDFGSESFHPYGSVWRNGANEATWIEVSDDVTINGESLPKGKYSFFVIPGESEWTLIFNSVWDQWGAYNYDSGKDVLRVSASAQSVDSPFERYTIMLEANGDASLNWGDFQVNFKIK
jgi:hypothetical protein